ncbi:hypothetical protein ACYFX5_12910 [Bremerella sp. T1]|uniref:hypothetical protein n=1 Tax=Bremerella sp. TYQ1 TaxID=3119568 RepID=UPI001CC91CAB|nr:hypothetical protein [Bremerella volcania]UBM33960.1 hypothetical protein LA756_14855 [Bremerella volcania]
MNTPPNPIVRCEKRWAVFFSNIVWNPLLFAAYLSGTALWSITIFFTPLPNLIAIPYVALSLLIIRQLSRDYHWVEVNEETIRAKGFWFRNVKSWPIHEIDAVYPMFRRNSILADSSPEQVLDALEGIEIEFRNGLPLIIVTRNEFTFAPEFCLVLLDRVHARPTEP